MTLPRTPSFRLDGRRALVTGASSGIGLACAAALAEAGAHVVCAARGAEKLEAAVAEIAAAGGSAEALPLDMADLDDLTAKLKAQPPFDVAVNSAGLARHGPALDTRPEDYDAVMAVNLRAAYFLSVGVVAIILTYAGLDVMGALSASATAISNVGPGLGPVIGPAGNFSTLSDFAKWTLSGAMLLGRLELFTVLVLLLPSFWRH